jgi:hypothetical protein
MRFNVIDNCRGWRVHRVAHDSKRVIGQIKLSRLLPSSSVAASRRVSPGACHARGRAPHYVQSRRADVVEALAASSYPGCIPRLLQAGRTNRLVLPRRGRLRATVRAGPAGVIMGCDPADVRRQYQRPNRPVGILTSYP